MCHSIVYSFKKLTNKQKKIGFTNSRLWKNSWAKLLSVMLFQISELEVTSIITCNYRLVWKKKSKTEIKSVGTVALQYTVPGL